MGCAMELQEFLSRLEGVKGNNNQYTAKCPAHDDRKASLCVSRGEDGKILLKCQAGCSVSEIASAMGLTQRDLFPEKEKQKKEVARYQYKDESGTVVGVKIRYSDKSFFWKRPDGKWKKPENIPLYNLEALKKNDVFIVEGEKDVDTITRLNLPAVCSPDGAGTGKWKDSYTNYLKGKRVYIIPDNDDVGKAFAQEEAEKISKVAQSVKILDLTALWDALPVHGDVSDFIHHAGEKEAGEALKSLMLNAPEWKKAPSPLLSCFRTLDEIEEQEATWLVDGWIPESQITLLAADGGIGKTTLWCNIAAAVSSGGRCVLDGENTERSPALVAFLTTEDSVSRKLKKKLRLAGANLHNITTMSPQDDKTGLLRELKFGYERMSEFIRTIRPKLCIYDPVQGFIPREINMGNRNAMRDCMAPLIGLGEETGTTFLVVCHTNKRKGAYGRDRIADSADLWDVSRSVLMAGYTDAQGVRYLSNEKNNYSELQETLLFTIDGEGQIVAEGKTWKRDKDFMQDSAISLSAPKREDCKEFIIHTLSEAGGSMKSKELEDKATEAGYSFRTFRRAKEELQHNGDIKNYKDGREWSIELISVKQLSVDEETPFD